MAGGGAKDEGAGTAVAASATQTGRARRRLTDTRALPQVRRPGGKASGAARPAAKRRPARLAHEARAQLGPEVLQPGRLDAPRGLEGRPHPVRPGLWPRRSHRSSARRPP